MTRLSKLRGKKAGTYHVKWPVRKHVENSVRGILRAIFLWFMRIDLDMSITAPDPHCPTEYHPDGEACRGHVVGCHWPRPMVRDGFFDPLKKLHKQMLISQMTLVEALRLETKDGYRITPIEKLLATCGTHIIALLEPKGDHRFELDWPWEHILAAAKEHKVRVQVYALPQNAKALPVAHRVGGWKTWVIKKKGFRK